MAAVKWMRKAMWIPEPVPSSNEVPDSPDQVQSSSGLHFLLYIKEMAQMKYKFLL
jgi:hypothetical protein